MKNIRIFYNYMMDKEVSIYKKILFILSFFYFILPFDLVPDFLIGLGWLDDLLVFIFILNAIRSELKYYKEKKKPFEDYSKKVIELKSKKKDE